MARSTQLFALLAVIGFTSLATAQSPVLAELYGRGVHAYHSGNTMQAHQYLTMAIDNGSRDPRAYYFRGVVNSATGRQYEAEEDWKTGATLEAQGEYGLAIGRSLQRVQGSMRIQMENIRQIVRLEQRANQSARNRARYEDLKTAETEVLRGGAATPPPAAAPAGVEDNPFSDDAADAGAAVPDSENNPFADDPAMGNEAPAAGGADPFGAPASEPAGAADPFGAPEPAGATPAPAGADPFGGGAEPAGGDPFGAPAEPAGAAPAGADPFGGDPFGGGSTPPAGGADMSDPFGGDPFGS